MEAKLPGFGSGPKLTGVNLFGDFISTAIGYGADKLEEDLLQNTTDVIESIEESENPNIDFSGQHIISTDN